MNILELLRRLYFLFPGRQEMAISRQQLVDFQREMICIQRLLPRTPSWFVPPVEYYPGLKVTPTNLVFKDRRLVIVERV